MFGAKCSDWTQKRKQRKRTTTEKTADTPPHRKQAAKMGMTFTLLTIWFLISSISPKAVLSIEEGLCFASIRSQKYLAFQLSLPNSFIQTAAEKALRTSKSQPPGRKFLYGRDWQAVLRAAFLKESHVPIMHWDQISCVVRYSF